MNSFRRKGVRPLGQGERWQREDESSRLLDEVQGLRELKIVIDEWRDEQHIPGARYTKHIIVSGAPARFEVPCGEPRCQEGGHDLTLELMMALRRKEGTIEGQSECRGDFGARPCARVVKFAAFATYIEPAP